MSRKRKSKIEEIEIGDLVEIVKGDLVWFVGVLDNVFMRDGVETFCVVYPDSDDDFHYATEIKLIRKA